MLIQFILSLLFVSTALGTVFEARDHVTATNTHDYNKKAVFVETSSSFNPFPSAVAFSMPKSASLVYTTTYPYELDPDQACYPTDAQGNYLYGPCYELDFIFNPCIYVNVTAAQSQVAGDPPQQFPPEAQKECLCELGFWDVDKG